MARVRRLLCACSSTAHLVCLLAAVHVNSEGIEMGEVPTDAKLEEMMINNPEYVAPLLDKVGREGIRCINVCE